MHSVIRRSFALPFGRRGGRLSLPTNCPCRTVGLHHAAKNLHTRLGPALFTFHGIRNRRVRYVFNRTARPAVNPAPFPPGARGMTSISRGPRSPGIPGVSLSSDMTKTKHDQDCCLRPKETIPNAPRTCNRLCWRKCQRFVIVSPWRTQCSTSLCLST